MALSRYFCKFTRQYPTVVSQSLSLVGRSSLFSDMATSHHSYLNLDAQKTMKHCHPAAERNKDPILQTLKKYVDRAVCKFLLEVSSGSGQHVSHIAPNFPNVTFQPTEFEKASLKSIECYVADSNCTNIKPPQLLDVRQPLPTWLNGTLHNETVDYILNINLIHISEWACAEGLFFGAGKLLKPGGFLFTYGPYANDGVITPDSNIQFDKNLRSKNPNWGLRDIKKELVPLAAKNGLQLKDIHELPANNKLLVWEKTVPADK